MNSIKTLCLCGFISLGALQASEGLNTSQAFVSLEVLKRPESRPELIKQISRCIQILRTIPSSFGSSELEGAGAYDILREFADLSQKCLDWWDSLASWNSHRIALRLVSVCPLLVEAITKGSIFGSISWACSELATEVSFSMRPYMVLEGFRFDLVSQWQGFLELNVKTREGFVDFSEFTKYRQTEWWNSRIEYHAQIMYALITLGYIFFPAVQAEASRLVILDQAYDEAFLDEAYDEFCVSFTRGCCL
ncbi:MAG: hypothetical protein QG632_463, partial [Candidatus Dependentiae bacterium]|nr:hypothetical protein [Candidatus Dependentiae bacterium]